MNTSKASRIITTKCELIKADICFDADGPDIYWNNVRIMPGHDGLENVIDAIKVLVDFGAESQ